MWWFGTKCFCSMQWKHCRSEWIHPWTSSSMILDWTDAIFLGRRFHFNSVFGRRSLFCTCYFTHLLIYVPLRNSTSKLEFLDLSQLDVLEGSLLICSGKTSWWIWKMRRRNMGLIVYCLMPRRRSHDAWTRRQESRCRFVHFWENTSAKVTILSFRTWFRLICY